MTQVPSPRKTAEYIEDVESYVRRLEIPESQRISRPVARGATSGTPYDGLRQPHEDFRFAGSPSPIDGLK